MNVLIAVDPGATGAIARFINGDLVEIADPVSKSLAGPLASMLVEAMGDPANSVSVTVERVNGAPGQSGPGSFNFGRSYGEILGVCIGLAVEFKPVPPATWKWAVGLRRDHAETPAQFKGRSVQLARDLWPWTEWFKRAKDDGRAEAALLGHYMLTQGLFA